MSSAAVSASLRQNITLAPGCYIIVAGTWMGDDEGEVGGDYTLEVDGAPVD